MSVTSSQLHPPSNWDHFEDICADLFALEWNYPQVVRHGRSGQRQKGVDIYGKQNGENAGVQCKGKRVWPPTKLTTSEIDKEINEAKKFSPKLKTFVFATIAEDDVNIQRHVNTISEQHEKTGLFSVHVYGWGELSRRIKNHPALLEKYFEAQTVPLIREDIRKSSDEIVGAIERLQEVVASREPSPAAPPTPVSEPDIFRAGLVDALERDFAQRYRRAMQRSFFPEAATTDEFYPLAQAILDGAASAVSSALRRRVLLRAARSTALRGNPDLSEQLLAAAVQLEGLDSDLPARARLLEARGQADEAIRLLRDEKDAEARSTLLTVIVRAKGEPATLAWLAEQGLSVSDLTAHGINTHSQIYLRQNDLQSAARILAEVGERQFTDCPYFYLLRGAIRFASIFPKPERPMVLGGLPLDIRRARAILPDAELAIELDAATADLQRALPLSIELGLNHAPRLTKALLFWADLLHPSRRAAALAQLKADMQEPAKALSLIQFAFAYDPQFDSTSIAAYLDKREAFGGLNDDELRARLAIALNKDDPAGVSDAIAKHRAEFEASFGKIGVASLEIQAFARTGDATSAKLLLDTNWDLFPQDSIAGFEADIAKAEGADPVAEHLRLYEATKTPEALRALLNTLVERKDHQSVARFAEELYAATNDPRDIALAAKAMTDAGDNRGFVRIVEAHPFLKDYDPGLRTYYAWQLFRFGRLDEASDIANAIRRENPGSRDLNLEIAVAIESGEWELIAQPLAAFLEKGDELDGPTLIRAAHLAQASGQGPLLDLVRAALRKGGDDPDVLLGAYTLYVEEGLEEEKPEAHQWFRRALALSGPEGPIQRFELKELLAKQVEWNEFTRKVNESVARGEMPLSVAGPGLRTTILELLLRNIVRNSALPDPRRRSAIPLFSGRRTPVPMGDPRRVALDISALLVLGWLGLLSKVLDAIPEVVLPAGVFLELFEGRRRIRQYQKSRLHRAQQIRAAIASGKLKVLRSPVIIRDSLTAEVGIELSALIHEADARNGIVLRPAPVHRLGLEGRDADMSPYAERLADMHSLLAALIEKNAVNQTLESTAKQYFSVQDKGWPTPAKPAVDRPLLLDGLAVVYLQTVDLFEIVLDTFKEVYVQIGIEEDATALIEHDRHTAEVLKIVDDIRTTIREARPSGKIMFGPRRVPAEEEATGPEFSTMNLLSDMTRADIVLVDDRAFNKEGFVQDTTGHRAPIGTTLDVIEELRRRDLIDEDERRGFRYRLRQGGALLMPVDGAELTAAVRRNRQNESPELRAIHESVDLARLADMSRFPAEIPWFVAVNAAVKAAIMEVWNTEGDAERAGVLADVLMEVKPQPEDWIDRWEGHAPPQWIVAVKRDAVVSLALPIELADEEKLKNYNEWLEQTVLAPLRGVSPEFYKSIIETLRWFMTVPWEEKNET